MICPDKTDGDRRVEVYPQTGPARRTKRSSLEPEQQISRTLDFGKALVVLTVTQANPPTVDSRRRELGHHPWFQLFLFLTRASGSGSLRRTE